MRHAGPMLCSCSVHVCVCADHEADTLCMIKHYTPLVDVEGVRLVDLDRLGMNAEVCECVCV